MSKFNVTGICVPNRHYMVDISPKIEKIFPMVEDGFYFTINRGRQYGKTTTLDRLEKCLPDDYICASISFQYSTDAIPEYSRDIEPTLTAGLKAHYYMQLVNNIRRYKGIEKIPSEKALTSSIKNLNDWNKIDAVYTDYTGDTQHRNHPGFQSEPVIIYTNTIGRNDFHIMKVAHDKKNLYFYAETVDDITPNTGDNWMRLFIDADRNFSTGWNGYDYRITGGQTLQRYADGEWKNVNKKPVKNIVEKNRMMITVPRSFLHLMTGKPNFEFKWSDNMQTEDPMDWYVNGDVAPGGRFNFVFQEQSFIE